jgi:hypothetical protein
VSMPAHDADHTGWDAKTLLTAPPDSADLGNRRPVSLDGVAPGREAAGIAALALALLADSRAWVAAQSPQFCHVPVEAMAISGAAVSPWRTPAEVIPCMRMYLWICAFDDYVESLAPGDGTRLDDLMRRCADVVRGGHDDSHGLLTALSDWQRDLAARALYPALSGLWIEKFDSMLSSMRWEWEAARSGRRDSAGLRDYLAHADSVAAWVTVLPRWITYGGNEILGHLDVLVAALGEYVIADRLANDLATFARERDKLGNNNVLRYGVSPDWVKTEIARHVNAVHRLLDDLAGDGVAPAIELVRETEYATAFYAMAEFRGWGSDAGYSHQGDRGPQRRPAPARRLPRRTDRLPVSHSTLTGPASTSDRSAGWTALLCRGCPPYLMAWTPSPSVSQRLSRWCERLFRRLRHCTEPKVGEPGP